MMTIIDKLHSLFARTSPLSVIPKGPGPAIAAPKPAPAAPGPTKTPILRSNPQSLKLIEEAKAAASRMPAKPEGDPFYSDQRRNEVGKQPSWLSAGAPRAWLNSHAGRPVRHVSAGLIRPSGEIEERPAPDYEPQPGVPGPRVIRGVL